MITVVGLNHKSAPIDIREKHAFNEHDTLTALKLLKNSFPDAEFVLLATCNRVELYCAAAYSGQIAPETLANFLAEFHKVPLKDFEHFLYVHKNEHAVNHLLTVASSLDSMVIGEAQIINQVKESYHLACAAKSTGKVLNRLFHCAFSTAKKVYTNTSIAHGRTSVAGVAVELASQLFADISSAKVVVIGAGEMGDLFVQHLRHVGCADIIIVNRSYDRALNIAERYGIMAKKWEELEQLLAEANIAIASAAVQDYLFKKKSLKKIISRRRKGALLILDIAVPRNFEPSVNDIEGVYLYSIDELSQAAEENRKAREGDILKAVQIVNENADDFIFWISARDIGPLIGQMRKQFAKISQQELDSFFVGSREDASCRNVMEPMVRRIVNRLLHCVIKNVNTVAKEGGTLEAAKLVNSIIQHAENISSHAQSDEEQQK
ncbi:MAG: glutamyl-tRNA reductase [Phycisphaerae bacterium]|nr:glutamyl-tRNA reductase [Phycisphaerae bacterium]